MYCLSLFLFFSLITNRSSLQFSMIISMDDVLFFPSFLMLYELIPSTVSHDIISMVNLKWKRVQILKYIEVKSTQYYSSKIDLVQTNPVTYFKHINISIRSISQMRQYVICQLRDQYDTRNIVVVTGYADVSTDIKTIVNNKTFMFKIYTGAQTDKRSSLSQTNNCIC